MQNKILFTYYKLRFRRWSRSRFAAFCSIGKCVNIGTVCKSIIEASLRKQPISISLKYITFTCFTEENSEFTDPAFFCPEIIILEEKSEIITRFDISKDVCLCKYFYIF